MRINIAHLVQANRNVKYILAIEEALNDPSLFFMTQMGIYAGAPGVAALAIVMKGQEVHGSQAHRLYPDMPNPVDLSNEMIRELITNKHVTMRMGLVCYPAERAFGRRSSALMYPPCGFGPSMPYRSGISAASYVSEGGRRLFSDAELQRQFVFEELAMEIGNITARYGADAKRAVAAFSSELFDIQSKEAIVLKYPKWQWDVERMRVLDSHLHWHIVVSRLFLLKFEISPEESRADTAASELSLETIHTLFAQFQSDYSKKRKITTSSIAIKSIIGVSALPHDVSTIFLVTSLLSHTTAFQKLEFQVVVDGDQRLVFIGHKR